MFGRHEEWTELKARKENISKFKLLAKEKCRLNRVTMKLSNFVLVHNNKINLPLKMGKNIIRRQRTHHQRFTSKQHCTIYVKEKKGGSIIILFDHSLNGTYVNNCFVKNKMINLSANDNIGFGNTLESFQVRKVDIIEIE